MSERRYLPTDKVEPNKFNPNVMSAEEFEALKADMQQHGPTDPLGVDPIIVSPKNVFYAHLEHGFPGGLFVIVDGFHRWKSACEIGWDVIPYEIREVTEDEAKALNYRRNKERGRLDPLKEAELFKSESMKQEAVAKKYNVSRSYVAARLQLLKLDEEVQKAYRKPAEVFKTQKLKEFEERKTKFESASEDDKRFWDEPEEPTEEELVPRGTLSTSHLEAIAALPEENQTEVAVDVLERGISARETERVVSRTNAEIAKAKRFKEALAKAKRRKCPSCGSDPEDFSYHDEAEFKCGKCYERWDYMKSKKEAAAEKQKEKSEHDKKASEELTKKFKEARENPRYIRTPETPEELHEKTAPYILRKVKQFTEVSRVRIEGKRGDETVIIDYTAPGSYTRMKLDITIGKTKFEFDVEAKDYKTKPDKARVNLGWRQTPSEETRKELRRFFSDVVNTDEDPVGVEI